MTPNLNTSLIVRIFLMDERIKGMFAGQKQAIIPIVSAAVDRVFGPVADDIVTRESLFAKRAELLQALLDAGYIETAVDALPRFVKMLIPPDRAKSMGREKVQADIAAMRHLSGPMDAETEAVALSLVKLGMLPTVRTMFDDGELTFRNLLTMQPGIAMITERKAEVVRQSIHIGATGK